MNCISTFAVGKMDSVEDLFFLHLRSLLTLGPTGGLKTRNTQTIHCGFVPSWSQRGLTGPYGCDRCLVISTCSA
jgi:hypothetical protein